MNSDSLSFNQSGPDIKQAGQNGTKAEVATALSREVKVGGAHNITVRQPFWWALLATLVISAIGGFAIYLIHGSTPPSPGSVTVNGKELYKAKSPPASNPAATKVDANPGSITPSVAGLPTLSSRGSQVSPSQSSQAVPSNPVTGAGGSTAVATVGSGASVAKPSLNFPVPGSAVDKRPAENPPLNPPASADSNSSLKWSKDEAQRKKSPADGKPAVANQNSDIDTARSFPPRSVNPVNPTSPATDPNTVTSSQKPQAPNTSATAPVAQKGNPSPAATPTGSALGRLRAAQDGQCADSNFFSRLVCDERVRLRFCRDRWNEHPDCTVQNSARDL